ncbi:putative ATP-dependent endonuclease of OLD family [Streptomyces sp. TLI_235]|nr:AAA family ATPase [Streptomyces sp. TLI_235]PBC69671.1 putative ATP-dependent endonuclease of OLD family [Streptomyces sp. TLI_235]
MHLKDFSVSGFRSLTLVENIPVGAPTILAGHNDGGKSAVLAALDFLLGGHRLVEQDRTYDNPPVPGASAASAQARCTATWVEGHFVLDGSEQAMGFPAELRIRRRVEGDSAPVLEYWARIPADPELRDIGSLLVPALRELVEAFGLQVEGKGLKADLQAALVAYAARSPQVTEWTTLPKQLVRRLPRLLSFSGKDESPDRAVHTALAGSYQTHLEDDGLQGRLRTIESEVTDRVRNDAANLCEHIKSHCQDLLEVSVEPEISFTHGFKHAHLHISRAHGEPVDLARSGRGSNRRIALAVWEWTSRLLEDPHPDEDGTPPVQTIVVYDEPDTHLDYSHQRTVMDLIRRQCATGAVKVIVATHSMNLIDGVDIADVVHLRLEAGRTVVERLTNDTHEGIDLHLGQIASALGLRNSVLLHERCFLAVEGATEQQAIPVLFRLSEGLSLQAAGIALWACNNNEGALHLARYLAARRPRRTVMLLVDADSRNVAKFFRDDRLRHFGLDPATQVSFVGEAHGFNELEELFDDEQWARVANIKWPRADGQQPWEAAHFKAHRGGRKFSKDILDMIKDQGIESPDGKPDMVYELATSLRSPSDVPVQLRDVFTALRAITG